MAHRTKKTMMTVIMIVTVSSELELEDSEFATLIEYFDESLILFTLIVIELAESIVRVVSSVLQLAKSFEEYSEVPEVETTLTYKSS